MDLKTLKCWWTIATKQTVQLKTRNAGLDVSWINFFFFVNKSWTIPSQIQWPDNLQLNIFIVNLWKLLIYFINQCYCWRIPGISKIIGIFKFLAQHQNWICEFLCETFCTLWLFIPEIFIILQQNIVYHVQHMSFDILVLHSSCAKQAKQVHQTAVLRASSSPLNHIMRI